MPGVDRSASSRQADAINTHEGLSKGSKVWVRNVGSHAAWELGELRSIEGNNAQVLLDRTNKTVTVKVDNMVAANPKLQEGIPDLTHLSYLNEPGILHNLNFRYATDDIYTFAGPVLIAVNPCKPLALYTTEVANAYKAGARDQVQSAHMAPHIYLVAANAFRRMLREKTSQSLIVNGESGAGKTETTKKAMQYFATLAGGTGVEDQVLETNPILEAFGNAKTLRNHNSSRFGKLIQIHFNQGHHICGAAIKTYLLEKSRVVAQLKGERSYHIFYQLVKGASKDMRKELRLPDQPTGFKYLASSGCTEIEGVNDAKEFQDVCHALGDIGIDAAQQAGLFRLLSGIMWLGNLNFKLDAADKANDAAKVVDDEACQACCSLLGVTTEALNTALTTKRINAAGEVVVKVLNLQEAKDCRDALAKALYAAAFDWIVARINAKLDAGKSRQGSGLSIAILDIYGFEQFQTNSFEQLCINYANERLQQQFTRHLFTLEQQEYESEGIDWTKVEFIDNWECVDAIEAAPPRGLGVLAVLDSQCKFPKATDASFVQSLKDALGKHTHFEINPRKPSDFTILHYAGAVSYSSQSFLDKNKDTLNYDLVELMLGSDASVSPLVSQLGTAIKEELEVNAKRGQTVGSRFSMQLRELIAELDATGLHFVRCIKPNGRLQPGQWEEAMALHQLRCCGVLEVARIARAGYPTRYTHQQFAERYAILLPRDQQRVLLASASMKRQYGSAPALSSSQDSPTGPLAACKQLLDIFGLHRDQYQIGYTKIFFRPGALGFVEDKWASMQSSALKIQTFFRMYCARTKYCTLRRAAITFQALYRSRHDRIMYEELKKQTRAAIVMQKLWRSHYERSRWMALQDAARVIQDGWRRHKFNAAVAVRLAEKRYQEELARQEQDKFESLRSQFGCEMDDVRAALAAWQAAKAKGGEGEVDLTQAMAAVQQERAVKAGVAAGAAGLAAGAAAGAIAAQASSGGQQVMSEGGASLNSQASHRSAATYTSQRETADPVVLQQMGSMGGAAAAAATIASARFAAAQETKETSERQALEIVRLQKQLQLERSLKDRYQHKYEEQNALWCDQIKLLQEYIQQVRNAFGDARLPPLPSALANAAGTYKLSAAGLEGQPMTPNGKLASTQADGNSLESSPFAAPQLSHSDEYARDLPEELQAEPETEPEPERPLRTFGTPGNGTLTRRGGGRVNGPLGAAAYMMHADDEEENGFGASGISGGPSLPSDGMPSARRPPGLELQLPSDEYGTHPDHPPMTPMEPDLVSPSRPVQPVHGRMQRAQPIQGRAAAQAAVDPRGGVAGKYVTQLDGELAKVQQVLDDDVDFIGEVAGGHVAVPNMDPAQELARLRKKFDLWRKEFKDKLVTAEGVLKKLDRMGGVQVNVPPRGQPQVYPTAPGGSGNGYGYYAAPTPGQRQQGDKGGFGWFKKK